MSSTAHQQPANGLSMATGTMQAAVLAAPRTVEIVERAIPQPGPNQAVVRLAGCGVCASSVPVWQGRPWFDYPQHPGSPGHEAWGRVHAIGENVQSLRIGDSVACISENAFAQFDVVDASAVVKIPRALAGEPLPGEPLACAVNVLRRADVVAGAPIVIIGIGFLGALLVQLAAHAGGKVIAVSRRQWSLDIARRCGAEHTVQLHDADSVSEAIAATAGTAAFSRVIEVTGTQIGIDVATRLIAVRGRLVVAGYHQDGVRQVNMQVWNWRGIDVINAHERDSAVYREGMETAVKKVIAGQIDLAPLLTHRFQLSEVGTALEYASRRPDGFIKGYLSYE